MGKTPSPSISGTFWPPFWRRPWRAFWARTPTWTSYVEFYTDAFLCALKRWLLAKDCMPAEEFTTLLRSCLLKTSTAILQQLSPQQETT